MTASQIQRAQAVRIHAYGGPEQMLFETVEIPLPAPGEVQVRQRAVGVNYLDTYHRRGVFPLGALPGVLGVEGAGEVVAVGYGVSELRVGDRVAYACPPVGSYTSLRNIKSRFLVRVPEGVTDEQAAAATLQGLTTHMLLHRVLRVETGMSVLVHSAAGGLGSLITQWAARIGCRVIGVVSSDVKADIALSQGCSDVIVSTRSNFVDETKRLTEGRGVDAVLEGVGGRIFHESLNALRPFGQIVNLGQAGEGLPSVALADLGPSRSLTVTVPGVFAYVTNHPDLQSAADTLYHQIACGELRVRVGGRYPLSDAAQAHRDLESRGTTGSLVLLPEDIA